MLHYGYRSTASFLRSRQAEIAAAFASAGLELTLDGLREDDPWAVIPPSAPERTLAVSARLT
jgi:hypothetical protein